MDYKQRVKNESKDLKEKITKLKAFVTSNKMSQLTPIDRELLQKQLIVMEEYSCILDQRIFRF